MPSTGIEAIPWSFCVNSWAQPHDSVMRCCPKLWFHGSPRLGAKKECVSRPCRCCCCNVQRTHRAFSSNVLHVMAQLPVHTRFSLVCLFLFALEYIVVLSWHARCSAGFLTCSETGACLLPTFLTYPGFNPVASPRRSCSLTTLGVSEGTSCVLTWLLRLVVVASVQSPEWMLWVLPPSVTP